MLPSEKVQRYCTRLLGSSMAADRELRSANFMRFHKEPDITHQASCLGPIQRPSAPVCAEMRTPTVHAVGLNYVILFALHLLCR